MTANRIGDGGGGGGGGMHMAHEAALARFDDSTATIERVSRVDRLHYTSKAICTPYG